MKQFLIGLAVAASSVPTLAQVHHVHWRHGHGHHHHGHWGHSWIAPTIIGGVIGYEIARNQQPVIVQQPPVIVQQSPDIVYIDGIAYRKQIIMVNGQYQEVLVRQ